MYIQYDNSSTSMNFIWDDLKNKKNQEKHGLSFELAKQVFDDENLICWQDERKEYGEERWIGLGSIANVLVVVVVYTLRGNDHEKILRIISARKASRKEREKYATTSAKPCAS